MILPGHICRIAFSRFNKRAVPASHAGIIQFGTLRTRTSASPGRDLQSALFTPLMPVSVHLFLDKRYGGHASIAALVSVGSLPRRTVISACSQASSLKPLDVDVVGQDGTFQRYHCDRLISVLLDSLLALSLVMLPASTSVVDPSLRLESIGFAVVGTRDGYSILG